MSSQAMLGCLVMVLACCLIPCRTLSVFDTEEVPEHSELVSITVSDVSARIGSSLRAQTSRNSMPTAMDLQLDSKGKSLHFRLRFDSQAPLSRLTTSFNGYARNIPEVPGDELPLITKSNNSDQVRLDAVPRLFTNSCISLKDLRNQAAFLVIRDPLYGSFKFLGSFFVGGVHYFVQPYRSKSSGHDGVRMHVSTETPEVDLLGDRGEQYAVLKGSNLGAGRSAGRRESTKKKNGNPSIRIHSDMNLDEDLTNEMSGALARSRQGRRSIVRNREPGRGRSRKRRQASTNYRVEVVLVCDYLCYRLFQSLYDVTDEIQTKNIIALFFSYVREYFQIAYSSVFNLYPFLDVNIDVSVPALFIASSSDVKIIGNFRVGDNNDVDSNASRFEFAIWVQDNLGDLLKADHFALVTGYDLLGNRFLRGVVGQVTRIGSICDIDSVSLNEFIPTLVASILSHELGHSLGAIHDSETGVCNDESRFIMAAFVGGVEILGNQYRFSPCSAVLFRSTLEEKACVSRDDFNTSNLPQEVPRVGQRFSLEEQCAIRGPGLKLCRQDIVKTEASWDLVCSHRLCEVEDSGICFSDLTLDYTTCGNKRWCERGFCVDNDNAPETPVDCPAGDSPATPCLEAECGLYDDFTRFVLCCSTCRPVKTQRFVIVGSTALG